MDVSAPLAVDVDMIDAARIEPDGVTVATLARFVVSAKCTEDGCDGHEADMYIALSDPVMEKIAIAHGRHGQVDALKVGLDKAAETVHRMMDVVEKRLGKAEVVQLYQEMIEVLDELQEQSSS